MNIKEIIKEYLEENGYDGLCNDECGCSNYDLMCCGEPNTNCKPAYLIKCGECNINCPERGEPGHCYLPKKGKS